MKVFIARHGEVPHNAEGRYNRIDEDLTEKGIRQAKELRNKIKDIPFDVVIASPLVRAKHTASILTEGEVEVDERLRERDCGSLSGQPLEVTNREEYWNYYSQLQYGTSEKMKDFFERIHSFLEDLKPKEYKSVLIVAHSGVSKAFSAYFEGIGDGEFLNRGLCNGEIKEYEL